MLDINWVFIMNDQLCYQLKLGKIVINSIGEWSY